MTKAIKTETAKPEKQFLIIHPETEEILGRTNRYHLAWLFAVYSRKEGEAIPIIAKVFPATKYPDPKTLL